MKRHPPPSLPPSPSIDHSMKRGKLIRVRKNKGSNLPPQLVPDFVKILNIVLVENTHGVQALPPRPPDRGHVPFGKKKPAPAGSSQRHHPHQQPPVRAGVTARRSASWPRLPDQVEQEEQEEEKTNTNTSAGMRRIHHPNLAWRKVGVRVQQKGEEEGGREEEGGEE